MKPKLRWAIWERDRGLCGFCGAPVPLEAMHIDHVLPRIAGGLDHPENLRASHPRCNQSANDKGFGKKGRPRLPQRGSRILRIDDDLYEVLAAWAQEEDRPVNTHMVRLLREACVAAGRWPAR